jgi:hypothetical protein
MGSRSDQTAPLAAATGRSGPARHAWHSWCVVRPGAIRLSPLGDLHHPGSASTARWTRWRRRDGRVDSGSGRRSAFPLGRRGPNRPEQLGGRCAATPGRLEAPHETHPERCLLTAVRVGCVSRLSSPLSTLVSGLRVPWALRLYTGTGSISSFSFIALLLVACLFYSPAPRRTCAPLSHPLLLMR